MSDTTEKTMPPRGPDGRDPPMPTPEEMANAVCTGCGAAGCRSYASDAVFQLRFFCSRCEPEEIREQRQHAALATVTDYFASLQMTNAESLSVLAVLLHMVGHAAGENTDALVEGVKEAEKRFLALFPHLKPKKQPATDD